MVEITASTKHSVKKAAPASRTTAVSVPGQKAKPGISGAAHARRGSAGPPLKASSLLSDESIKALTSLGTEEKKNRVHDLFRAAIGEHPSAVLNLKAPHAASTTRDRAAAAADVAIAAKELGVVFVLKECGLLQEIQRILFPQGIEVIIGKAGDGELSTLKPSVSALSLASLGDESSTGVTGMTDLTIGSDSKRGKTTPPNAREGCLLVIRGLCQMVGQKAEPYVVGAFLAAALDECASAVSAVREAAEDATSALITLASPWSFHPIIAPLLLNSLASSEWRVKAIALERLQQCTLTASQQVRILIPTLIPAVTNQVWDTKAQVSKAARLCLQSICDTNNNADIKPAIPAIVNAICKPADTNKAVSELMGTTFVVPVSASTLAILCPVLARALKEKLAIHKRAACVVITNMSKLVETRQAIAPFGSLLVPELKKVSQNVQFEEIRDEALKALSSLTKALGDAYTDSETQEPQSKEDMKRETSLAEAEQERIRQEREAETRKEEEIRQKEEEERRKFKEAMDAQRELDKLSAAAVLKKKQDEELSREKQKLSTKSATGVCQGCGLKKCKKSCLFFAS